MIILNMDLTECISISPGQHILCPGIMGDYFKMIIGDGNVAESKGGMCALIKYCGIRKVFYVSSLFDSRRIASMEF